MNELKDCPFCGGKAVASNYVVEAAVRCVDCRATIKRTHGQYDDIGYPEAIDAWNRRASDRKECYWPECECTVAEQKSGAALCSDPRYTVTDAGRAMLKDGE
jgi:hypothetical protein